ncbi:MAG: isoleucine--tRNA ligase, partial [Acidobacteria bacterium]|nr:isoleucine--tRNA ligase [Acidobacteriota bacterium]
GEPIEESVHTRRFPEAAAGPADGEMYRRWERLLELRAQVLKALEVARAEGLLGNSLEARVILEAEGETLALLQRYSGFLKDLFIVSDVSLAAPAPIPGALDRPATPGVRVERAPGGKCERCWRVTTDVGSDPSFRTVCARCAAAVRSIVRARGGGA